MGKRAKQRKKNIVGYNSAPVFAATHCSKYFHSFRPYNALYIVALILFASPGVGRIVAQSADSLNKSNVSTAKPEPALSLNDFPIYALKVDTSNQHSRIENYRYQPLTATDSITWQYIIGQKPHTVQARMENLHKNLAKGYLSAGPLLIELKHLIGYTDFEGLKLGIGLWSSEQISKKIKLGGFYKHAFKKNLNYYGGGFEWTLINERETRLALDYKNARTITGEFTFLRGPKSNIAELFRRLRASTMDKTEVFETSIHSRFLQDFRGQLVYTYSRITPVVNYPFYREDRMIDEAYSLHESGVRLRWNNNERPTVPASQLLTSATHWPTVWFNFTLGVPNHPSIKNNFTRSELQIEQTFYFTAHSTTTLRLTGGTLGGTAPNSRLYSYMGTYHSFSVEVPFMFATMSSNEFAADRFTLAFIRHTIPLCLNNPGSFKPQLVLSSSAGWGDISNKYKSYSIGTFNKGYYESGLYLRNLLSLPIVKYGFGAYYRYGPYQKPKTIDNFSFRIGFEFSL